MLASALERRQWDLRTGPEPQRDWIYVSPGIVYSEEVETLCDLAPQGLAVWAAASMADPIPGDAVFLGFTAAATEFGCSVRDEFVEHYPDADGVEFKRIEDQYGYDELLVTPTYELPWWLPPIA